MSRLHLLIPSLLLLAASCGGAESASAEPGEAASLGLPNEHRLSTGLIVGGHPDAAALESAAQAGAETVISLQTPSESGFEEERSTVGSLGMTFVSIPIAGADGVTLENATRLHAALERPEATVLHCASGNRVGALLALRAFHLEGRTRAEALELGRSAGLSSLEATVVERLAQACADAANADRC